MIQALICHLIYESNIPGKKLVDLVKESGVRVREARGKIEIAGPYDMFHDFYMLVCAFIVIENSSRI